MGNYFNIPVASSTKLIGNINTDGKFRWIRRSEALEPAPESKDAAAPDALPAADESTLESKDEGAAPDGGAGPTSSSQPPSQPQCCNVC